MFFCTTIKPKTEYVSSKTWMWSLCNVAVVWEVTAGSTCKFAKCTIICVIAKSMRKTNFSTIVRLSQLQPARTLSKCSSLWGSSVDSTNNCTFAKVQLFAYLPNLSEKLTSVLSSVYRSSNLRVPYRSAAHYGARVSMGPRTDLVRSGAMSVSRALPLFQPGTFPCPDPCWEAASRLFNY